MGTARSNVYAKFRCAPMRLKIARSRHFQITDSKKKKKNN